MLSHLNSLSIKTHVISACFKVSRTVACQIAQQLMRCLLVFVEMRVLKLDLDVNTCWKVKLHQLIDGLRSEILDV